MALLLQLNGDLPEKFPGHERRLYVFACRRKTCRRKEGAIRVLRGLKVSPDAPSLAAPKQVEEEKKKPKPAPATGIVKPGLGDAIFGVKTSAGGSASANPFSGNKNPFSKPAAGGAPANPFSKPSAPIAVSAPAQEVNSGQKVEASASDLPKTFAQTLSLNNTQNQPLGPAPPPEPWPVESKQPAPYPVSWLADAEYETLDPTPTPKVTTANSSEMDIDSGEGSGGGKEDKDVFESTMDSTFQKFADRVGQNFEQCIRYEFGGQPLLYSKTDTVGAMLHVAGEGTKVSVTKGMPRCPNCGGARVFEVQMTPQAIVELEADEEGLDGMDWGTIIVGVCGADCQGRTAKPGEVDYLEEWAGVQWEELDSRR
jgi:pre-rRNA-processing protein TSR4